MDATLEKLLSDLQEIKLLEIEAQKIYKALLPLITQERDKTIVQGIIEDEKRHEQIAQECIDVLQA